MWLSTTPLVTSKQRESLNIMDNSQVLEVIQWEIGCIWKDESKNWVKNPPRYIESKWAWPCIIITAYNEETGKVCLAHIDAVHWIGETLWVIWKSNIRIIWWWDQETVNEAIMVAQGLWMKILEIDWPTNGGSRSVIIDSQTWEVYNTYSAGARPRVQKILSNPFLGTTIWMWAQLSHMKTWRKPACRWVFDQNSSWNHLYDNL